MLKLFCLIKKNTEYSFLNMQELRYYQENRTSENTITKEAAVIISDGLNDADLDMNFQIEQLTSRGVQLFALKIGKQPNINRLTQIVGGNPNNVLDLNNFQQVTKAIRSQCP